MTQEEYQKLVKESVSFKEMDEATQAKILAAEGEEMGNYMKIFQDEKQLLTKAWEEMQKNNDQVINNFMADVKSGEAKKRSSDEEKAQQEEEKRLNGLLNQI